MRGVRAGRLCLRVPWAAAFFLLAACAVDRFSEFSVESVSIGDNGVIGTGREKISITFSKEVEDLSAEESVRVETGSGLEVSLFRKISGNRVVLEPVRPWAPHERFWLVIEKGMKDVYGKEMGRAFHRPFQSTGELLPVSAVLVDPEVLQGKVCRHIDFLELAFNRDVDRESVERVFSLSPSVPGYFEWTANLSLVYRFLEPLAKNSVYTLRIGGDGRDREGFPIKPYTGVFEFFPNEPYPVVETIRADGVEIFDVGDPLTYRMENGKYVVEYEHAEKDQRLLIRFSKPMDKATLRENLRVSPFEEWNERWIDDRTVEISFVETLPLGSYYELELGNGIGDSDGLGILRACSIYLTVAGPNSRFLEFYASDFAGVEVEAYVTDYSGGSPPSPVEVESLAKGSDEDGDYLRVRCESLVSPENADVELFVTLRFLSPASVPVIDRGSLQDAVRFSHILGIDPETSDKTGGIQAFDWAADNACVVRVGSVGGGNIYALSIGGGKSGVVDSQNNYMMRDAVFYFKLFLDGRDAD